MRVKTMWPAMLVAGLLMAAPAQATFPGAPGMVASNGVTLDDPNDDRPAITYAGGGGNPVFSADGTKVAYTQFSNETGLSELWVRSIETGAILMRFNFQILPNRHLVDTPAWAPDGSIYAFVHTPDANSDHDDVWKFDVASGSGGKVGQLPESQRFVSPVISPDGTKIAARRTIALSGTNSIVTMSLSGTGIAEIPASSKSVQGSLRFDWRPDGNGYLIAQRAGNDGGSVRVFTAGGALVDEHVAASASDQAWTTRFTPDGGHTARKVCSATTCTMTMRRIPDSDADVAPDRMENLDFALPGVWPQVTDWQPQKQPVVFIHGFAGSKLGCGGDETWLPTPFAVGADLLDMRLGPDGSSNLAGTCGVGPTALLEDAFVFSDVYGTTRDWLEGLAGDRAHMFVWDWRKDPREVTPQLDASLDTYLDTPAMKAQNVRKVAIVAHSMGGLVTRAYTHDATRAKRIARAITVGTPYNGAPKAIFPLAFGTEMPGAGGDLDLILPDSAFRAFAQTMTGLFFLMPSAPYGGWLKVAGREPKPLDGAGVRDYAGSLGANIDAFDRAVSGHATDLDGFKRNGVDLRVLLGMGLATIASVAIEPAPDGPGFDVIIGYANGDETVPSRSASQGPTLTTTPLGDHVSLMNVCDVGHMKQTGSPKVQAPLEDFLLFGTPPRRTRQLCTVAATEAKFYGMERPDTSGGRALTAGQSDAVTNAQIIDLPGSVIAVTQDAVPAQLVGTGTGAYVAVSAIGDETRGAATYYGPITGEVKVQTGTNGVTVLDDGAPVSGTPTRPPGLSDLGGDPTTTVPAGSGTDPTTTPGSTATPTGTTTPPVIVPGPRGRASLRIPRRGLRVSRNRVAVPVRCAAGAPCAGRVVIRPVRRGKPFGTAAFKLANGRSGTVRVKLRGVGRAAVRRGVKVKVVLTNAGGGTSTKATRMSGR